MIFPVIGKFVAELVRKSQSCFARNNVKYEPFSSPGQVTPRQTDLTVYAYTIYQQMSLAY